MAGKAIVRKFRGIETRDGAGVKLRRIFGFRDTETLDPFLLLDAFGSTEAKDYLPGFPWHPHRGIETVTYLLEGSVRHGDSMGNSGVIGPGDLQWMTAGSGIIHEEMPQLSPKGVLGFQLWLNLAASEKMGEPAYRGVLAADVPVKAVPGGSISVLAGVYEELRGPVAAVARDPLYFDLRLSPQGRIELETPEEATAFAFVFEGSLLKAEVPGAGAEGAVSGDCLLFGRGDSVLLEAGPAGARCIFAAALPLRESVAWGGPIVMNTQAELDLAFRELDEGTFVKTRGGEKRP
jgi:redox-sensitive bicupin YhaK (pirin superfamily)